MNHTNTKNRNSAVHLFLRGIYFGIGFLIVISFVVAITFYVSFYVYSPQQIIQYAKDFAYGDKTKQSVQVESNLKPANFTAEPNPYKQVDFQFSQKQRPVLIDSVKTLMNEVDKANRHGGKVLLILKDGVYNLTKTLQIKQNYISLVSLSADSSKVVLQGSNKKFSGLNNLIRVTGKYFMLDGITLRNAKWHLVQIAGESNADFPVLRNCKLLDSNQQLVKVSYDARKRPQHSSDYGLIENCTFQYTDGIGPHYYIGGIDLHAGNSWIIRNNVFKDIASPEKQIAQHALHVWNNAQNTLVDNNTFIDCDRAIGFGMMTKRPSSIVYSHKGGSIQDNLIIHSNNGDPFADTGIILEDSPLTLIQNNKIWLEHNYPNAIEYRYKSTTGVVIQNNFTNKAIKSRNGAEADLINNQKLVSVPEILFY